MPPHKSNINPGCREWTRQIPDLLDQPRDDETRRAWERHTEICDACRTALEEDANLRAMFQRSFNPGSARVAMVVMDRIRASSRTAPLFRQRDLGWTLAGVVAGVFLGLLLSGALPNSTTKTNTIDSYAGILSDLTEETVPYWTEFYVNLDATEESMGDSVQ